MGSLTFHLGAFPTFSNGKKLSLLPFGGRLCLRFKEEGLLFLEMRMLKF